MNYQSMTIAELRRIAQEKGVLPEEGSGIRGSIVKADLIAVLEPMEISEPEEPAKERYLYDTDYVVVKPFGNYEEGVIVNNLSRLQGQPLLESGAIELA